MKFSISTAAFAVSCFLVDSVSASYFNSCTPSNPGWWDNANPKHFYLVAECKTTTGAIKKTKLDLSKCIANDNGFMVARANGGFHGSCSGMYIESGRILTASCRNNDGVYLAVQRLSLEPFVSNQNGVLSCFGIPAVDW
ncbi:Cyanovirin-N [Ascobolus immersus RN42]|uniref:Cyanovirin-N n=1 Tax=Ascobolus immersus RN42 TaxID=1160509 RepID=A0A3N4IFS2_ASCIM|nr:Cyanovirin-N [Ascobolus immersus RN42]